MEKKMKKGLSLLLALMLCVGMLPGVCLTAAANTSGSEPTEIEINSWAGLQEAFSGDGGAYKLTADVYATATDTALVVDAGATVKLDLAGHVIDRRLTAAADKAYGNVITVKGTLTLTDSIPTVQHLKDDKPVYTYDSYSNGWDAAPVSEEIKGGIITGGNNSDSGGGIVVDGGTLTLNGGTICNNHSGDDGGGIFVDHGGKVTIEAKATIVGNIAKDGGGVSVYTGSGTMGGGTICYNHVDGDAGGVNVGYLSSFKMTSGTISRNKAYRGGGVYNNQGTFLMSGGTIFENTANRGGGIYQQGATAYSVVDGSARIEGNIAEYNGGGVYAGYSKQGFVLSENACISGNEAKGKSDFYGGNYEPSGGGGVYLNGCDFFMGGSSVIEGNRAASGGGVHVDGFNEDTAFFMLAGTIRNNKALESGGGIFINGAKWTEGTSKDTYCYMLGGTISDNEAYGEVYVTGDDTQGQHLGCGGGVYIGRFGHFLINAPIPAGVTVPGGLVPGGTPTITGNESDFGGGVYVDAGYEFSIDGKLEIIGNDAGTWAGEKFSFTDRALTDPRDDNVYLCGEDAVLSLRIGVYGVLDDTSRIGVTTQVKPTQGTPVVITNGLFEHNNRTYRNFTSDDPAFAVGHNGEEALLCVGYTVTFDTNGGTPVTIVQKVMPGAYAVAPDAKAFSRSDYSFDDWYLDDSLTTKVDVKDNGELDYQINADTTFYAKWTKAPTPPPPGPSPTTYPVTIVDSTGGKVTSDKARAAAGATVTLTVTPDKDYTLETLTVTNKTTNTAVTFNTNGDKRTFTMPASEVVVASTFKTTKPSGGGSGTGDCPRDETCPMYPYTDLDRHAWYHDGVHYCIERGFMIGYGDNTFRPDRHITRAELVQVFFNVEKQPAATADLSGYKDLDPAQWYIPAIRWAVENNILEGYGDGTMRPNEPITREQIAAVYMRYSAWKGYTTTEGEDTNILSFPDYDQISKWAIPYVQWAVGAGLMLGRDDNGVPYLTPLAGTMRSEAATLQMRFCEKHGI